MARIVFDYGDGKTRTDVGVIYEVKCGGRRIGRVARTDEDSGYWYATPGVGNPFVTTNGVRHGFGSRREASVWLAGVFDAGQAWLTRALADVDARMLRARRVAAVKRAADVNDARLSSNISTTDGLAVHVVFANRYHASVLFKRDDLDYREVLITGPTGEVAGDIDGLTDFAGIYCGAGDLVDVFAKVAGLEFALFEG